MGVYSEIICLKGFCDSHSLKYELKYEKRGYVLKIGRYLFAQHDKTPLSQYGYIQDEKGTIKTLSSAKNFIRKHKGEFV